jgi:hypothetical protein
MSNDLSNLPRPDGVYVIYSMDATCSDERIDNMGPLNEFRYWPQPAPIADWMQTEDNNDYSYDYLGREYETNMSIYRSAEDAEAPNVPVELVTELNEDGFEFQFSLDGSDYWMRLVPDDRYPMSEWRSSDHEQWAVVLDGKLEWESDDTGAREVWTFEVEPATNVPERPMGRHRKWVADLTFEQWEAFASNYCIELHDNGMPVDYTDTMGSLTEFGLLPAISVDNTEGWGDNFGDPVIDSSFYCSFYTLPRQYSDDRGAMVEDARIAGVEDMLEDYLSTPTF